MKNSGTALFLNRFTLKHIFLCCELKYVVSVFCKDVNSSYRSILPLLCIIAVHSIYFHGQKLPIAAVTPTLLIYFPFYHSESNPIGNLGNSLENTI